MKRLFDRCNCGLGIVFSLAYTLFQRNLWSGWKSKWRQKRITSHSSPYISFGLNQCFFLIFRHAVSGYNFGSIFGMRHTVCQNCSSLAFPFGADYLLLQYWIQWSSFCCFYIWLFKMLWFSQTRHSVLVSKQSLSVLDKEHDDHVMIY